MRVFIARQPVFDRDLEVFGYELLSRSPRMNAFDRVAQDQGAPALLDACTNIFPLEFVTQNRKAFISTTSSLLRKYLVQVLPPEQTVVQILESVDSSKDIVSAVRKLKELGYSIALDDFAPGSGREPLAEFADIIKVDFQATSQEQRREILERHGNSGKVLMAAKVDTHLDYHQALEAGYSLFQGFFFCQPEMLERRELSRFEVNYLRFLAELAEPELDIDRIEAIIKQEASLALRLLRYLNSAVFGLREEIKSIRQALAYLGEEPLRRWGSLVAVVGVGDDKPSELVVTTLIRARFCEMIGSGEELDGDSLPMFLTGLFSTLDALLDLPLEDALQEMALAEDIRVAILGDDSLLAQVLKMACAFEQADWDSVEELAQAIGIERGVLALYYAQAVRWVDEIFGDSAASEAA